MKRCVTVPITHLPLHAEQKRNMITWNKSYDCHVLHKICYLIINLDKSQINQAPHKFPYNYHNMNEIPTRP